MKVGPVESPHNREPAGWFVTAFGGAPREYLFVAHCLVGVALAVVLSSVSLTTVLLLIERPTVSSL